jgi:hypothetical protein
MSDAGLTNGAFYAHLSPDDRDRLADGCPSAALLDDRA